MLTLGANHRDHAEDDLGVNGSGFNIPNLYNISNAQLVTAWDYPLHKVMNSAVFFRPGGV